MRAAGRLLTALALCSLASPAHGHETRLAFLEVRALGAGDFVSVLKIPVTGATAWPIEVRLPATCAPRGPDRRSRQADSLVVEQRFFCDVNDGAPVMGLAGLAGGFVDVLVRVEDEDGNRLTRVALGPLTEIPLTPGSAGAWDPLALGVEHILGGVDHLLFVAGMILRRHPWSSDRKLRMLASRPQFLADGVLKSIAVPHFVSNQGADCIGLYRTTGATTSRPVFGGAQDNDVFGSGRVRALPTADGSLWTGDVAARAHRLVVVDVPVDADDARRRARVRQVRERQPWVGGDQQRHPDLIEARLRHPCRTW